MNFYKFKLREIKLKIIIYTIIFIMAGSFFQNSVLSEEIYTNEEVTKEIELIFQNRNRAILSGDTEFIESIYDGNTTYGVWALGHEKQKMQYLHKWEEKQGVKFTEINPKIVIRRIKGNGNKFSANLLCSTEYKYVYEDAPDIINSSRIGTYHSLNLINKDGVWIITKEWYTDPFADSLNISDLKVESIKQHILSQGSRDLSTMNKRRTGAAEYAKMYCGAASEEQYGFKYNKKYRDYNPQGGDCANFASQVLFEGAKFKKTSAWNYNKGDVSRAWVNADGFKSYMVNSGRASVIAHGSYEKVYKSSYKLLPGDFVAYEKKGDITHISVVTGADSRGYSLVTCHNTDRNNVPWDLGWSDKKIKFWLVRVNH